MSLPILKDNSVEMTAKQLLEVTEGIVRGYFNDGRRDLPIPTKEDIWVVLQALNFTVWLCPATGQQAVKLLEEKYGTAQKAINQIVKEL